MAHSIEISRNRLNKVLEAIGIDGTVVPVHKVTIEYSLDGAVNVTVECRCVTAVADQVDADLTGARRIEVGYGVVKKEL